MQVFFSAALEFFNRMMDKLSMITLALYQPDIPQNVGAAMRLCACLGVPLDIVEPCGFPWDARRIRQSAMDYYEAARLTRHTSWQSFRRDRRQRLILITTKAAQPYTSFDFRADDVLLMGRESAGVPDDVHDEAYGRLFIPMVSGMRSMNVINAASLVLGEALRQTDAFAERA